MQSTAADTELLVRLRTLQDHSELAALNDRFLRHLDQDRDDASWFGTVFTEDASLTFPMGEYVGKEGLTSFLDMGSRTFERTHHIASNYGITVDGGEASVTASLTAVHVPDRARPDEHFSVGGRYEVKAVRTEAGWRIRRFVFDLVWTSGDGPVGRPET